MPDYKVVLVDDQDLPSGVDWAIARCPNGRMIAFLKRSRMTCADMLQEAWAAADECQHPPRQKIPA